MDKLSLVVGVLEENLSLRTKLDSINRGLAAHRNSWCLATWGRTVVSHRLHPQVHQPDDG